MLVRWRYIVFRKLKCDMVQDCSNSIASAMELPKSCTKSWYVQFAHFQLNVILWYVEPSATIRSYSGLILGPDSKVHGANMGPTWVLTAPDGPHDGPMNLAIRGLAPSQWETLLQSNPVSHSLGTRLESALLLYLDYTLLPAILTPALSIKLTTPQQPTQFYYDRSWPT